MTSHVWLAYYCVAVLVASIAGGMIPMWFRLTHRWMETAVSFVAGIMFGVAMLHLLPHALLSAWGPDSGPTLPALLRLMLWFVAGLLAMFFIERFFCYHHHDAPGDTEGDHAKHEACEHATHSDHVHDITWSGATIGLTLHSVLGGIALAASVSHAADANWFPGLGAFLVIFLHKPFDSMTISTLMARSGWSVSARVLANALFALAVPLGALAFALGISSDSADQAATVAPALAFSAGVFLCIAGSDLLPELQFHHHDRALLSLALLAGLSIAYLAGRFEAGMHRHPSPIDFPPTVPDLNSR
jgi:zinc and cadmium transporter